jgi:hypothetical protein
LCEKLIFFRGIFCVISAENEFFVSFSKWFGKVQGFSGKVLFGVEFLKI